MTTINRFNDMVASLRKEPTTILEKNPSIPRDKWRSLGDSLPVDGLEYLEYSSLEWAAAALLTALDIVLGGEPMEQALLELEVALWRFIYVRDVPLPKSDQAEIIGRNLLRLSRECGWGPEDLEEKTNIARRAIITACSGQSIPHANSLAAYAEAFTKGLGRNVSVEDLLRR